MRRIGVDKDRQRARQKLYYQSPGARGRRKLARQNPTNKAKKGAYDIARGHQPVIQERKKTRRSLPAAKAQARAGMLRRKYGMTAHAYDSMMRLQEGSCAICRGKDWGFRGPVIDHDHETGEVRGILCGPCNLAIGLLRDSPERAMKASKYLTKGKD